MTDEYIITVRRYTEEIERKFTGKFFGDPFDYFYIEFGDPVMQWGINEEDLNNFFKEVLHNYPMRSGGVLTVSIGKKKWFEYTGNNKNKINTIFNFKDIINPETNEIEIEYIKKKFKKRFDLYDNITMGVKI